MAPAPSSATPTPPRSVAPRNWWSRNWKWFVPTGCMTMILLAIGFFALIFVLVFSAMKSSDAYKEALQRAQTNPAVIEALGTPIKDGMFVSGNTKVENGVGEADLSIPITGPKGSGTIYAVATKSGGNWTYTKLEVEIKGRSERIDLLPAEPAP